MSTGPILNRRSRIIPPPQWHSFSPPLTDLRDHTLLHVQWRTEDDAAPSWRMWLRAAGIGGVDAERGPRFSLDSMALEAAIAGQGVALASAVLVEGDLAAGRLVRPFPPSASQATAFSYYLVYPEAKADGPKVVAFRDWVLGEVAPDENAAVST
jgi:LysR family glycine cleavage system transcriptional activator